MSNNGVSPKKASRQPEAKPCSQSQYIRIKVVSLVGREVIFKMKMTTKMEKLKEKYYKRVGVDKGHFILHGGPQILDHHTPKMLEMKDGDIIEMLVEF